MSEGSSKGPAEGQSSAPTITFAINGERFDVNPGKFDLTTSLNTFIRRETRFKGTKLGCGEGGCGACVVDLSRSIGGSVAHYSVNSCLRPLASMDGWAVTTTEGLGNSKKGFHPIQERIANFNGSQCGFCTPGMVMSLYSTLKEKSDRTMTEIEERLDGNICRCTGFRPILDAMKSFAVDSNVENQVNKITFVPGPYDASIDPEFPSFLSSVDRSRPLSFKDHNGRSWVRPSSLSELLTLAATSDPRSTKFINAGTSVGYFKDESDRITHYIDISATPELYQVSVVDGDNGGLTVGAANSISSFISALRATESSGPAADKVRSFGPLAKHAARVASVHVRNIGSIAGNLIIAKTRGFVSDLATILLGAGATVTWATLVGQKVEYVTESIDQFFSTTDLKGPTPSILYSITVPWTNGNTQYRTFKAAPRPQQAVASINAALSVDVDMATGKVSGQPRVAFGGVMEPDRSGSRPIRATNAEAALADGNIRDRATIERVIAGLRKDFESATGPVTESEQSSSSRKFKERLVVGFLYKYLVSVLGGAGGDIKLDQRVTSALLDPSDRSLTSASQNYTEVNGSSSSSSASTDPLGRTDPVGKAIPHIAAKLQAAGEAVYTDDIGEVAGTLFAALVMSSEARATIVSVDASEALKIPGVKGYYTVKDVPGKNNCSPLGQNTPVFADGKVEFKGQSIGVVVGETEKIARAGAKAVRVVYDNKVSSEGGNPTVVHPVRNIDDALRERGEFVTPVRNEYKLGDPATALASGKYRAQGVVYVGTQHHFYMETQTAYVIPDEDQTYQIHLPTQWPDAVNTALATVLGVPHSRVRAIHRRAGGAFGGKLTHTIYIAAAAAVASYNIRRPVRLTLDRIEDFILCGGREESKAEYDISFDENGRIQGLKMEGYLNAGSTIDLSWFTNFSFPSALNEAYYIPNIVAASTVVRSNLAPRTVVRGPGETQASYVMETIIEHVSHVTGVRADLVRERNFCDRDNPETLTLPNGKKITNYTIPELWKRVKEKADYEALVASVQRFNSENRWKKRGVSITPVRYEVNVFPKTAMVNIYGDGSIIVTHGGSEMGQGLNTKTAQLVAFELGKVFGEGGPGIDMRHIKFGDVNTQIIPNATFTGGSTGSEGTAEAARRACAELVSRLKPVLEGVRAMKKAGAAKPESPNGETSEKAVEEAQSPTITWLDLCMAAKFGGVHLSAQGAWEGSGESALNYQNFGAAASSVEVDVITGEVQILSVDLVYDCGRSLNPAIDIGQCEGAFLMGVGHWMREHVDYGVAANHMSASTFLYHPPMVKDVPGRWSVELLQDSRFEKGILSSKASGEPPLVLATSVAMAVRAAVNEARKDAGLGGEFWVMEAPFTPESIQTAAGTEESQFKF